MCLNPYDCWLHKDGVLIKECWGVAWAAEIIAEREGLNKHTIYKRVMRAFKECEPFMGYMVTIFPPAGYIHDYSKTLRRKQAAALQAANIACNAARRQARTRKVAA